MSLHHGDCLEVMATLSESSVDAIVTDPPYGIGFMAKDWDAPGGIGDFPMRRTKATNTVNTGVSRQGGRQQQGLDFQKRQARDARSYEERSQAWAEAAYRVAKPGAYLLAFGGTRTVHRMTSGIEDAGWIIRDCLVWAYAQGFPKSRALLKPAWEPIVMARKPGPLRMLDIEGCRIGFASPDDAANTERLSAAWTGSDRSGPASMRDGTTAAAYEALPAGRWPANVILTDPIFDGDVEGVVGGGDTNGGGLNHLLRRGATTGAGIGYGSSSPEDAAMVGYDDTGTYSRFFLIPKASRSDREPVFGGLPLREARTLGDKAQGPLPQQTPYRPAVRANVHPTVKPLDLMRHLVRLVTPPNGTVLDPFLGSGTTAIAAEMEGFAWLGIEREAEYVQIAEARLLGVQKGLGLSA